MNVGVYRDNGIPLFFAAPFYTAIILSADLHDLENEFLPHHR